jgi:hypothetical protein
MLYNRVESGEVLQEKEKKKKWKRKEAEEI